MECLIQFDFAAVVVLAVVMAHILSVNKLEPHARKLFIMFLALVLAATVLEMISYHVKEHGNLYIPALREIISCSYFLSFLVISVLYAYLNVKLYYLYYQMKISMLGVMILPAMTALALVVANPALHLLFTYDAGGNYVRGKGFPIFVIAAMFYWVFSVNYQYRFRVALPRTFKNTLVVVYAGLGLAVLGQIFEMKKISIFSVVTIGILILVLQLQDIDEFCSTQTSLLNKKSMKRMLYIRTQGRAPFKMYVMKVGGFSYLRDIYEEEYTDKIVAQVGAFVEETFKGSRCFQIGEHAFAAIVTEEKKVKEEEVLEIFEERFAKYWEYQSVVIDLCCKIGVVKYPNDADSAKKLFQYMECVEKEEHFHKDLEVLDLEAIDFEKHKRESDVERAIARALKHNGFKVYYQPIYSTAERKFVSAEALIRLYDKELGNISPEEFIPIAEKNGSILKIGLYVFETVCRFIAEQNLETYGIDYVEINLSVVQCMQSKLSEQLVKIMKQHHVRSEQINLEITETTAADVPEKLKQNMNNLYEEGIQFSLDDYGNGYSNISSVINLPLNYIKLDKSIIWSAFEDTRAYTAMASSIEMFKKLNLKVIAEGIETLEQSTKLCELGCDHLQGYYYSKPLPENEFLQYLDKENAVA